MAGGDRTMREAATVTSEGMAISRVDGDDGSGPFPCPRCRTDVFEPHYGPCLACRTELRATVGGPARQIDAPSYEPKVNVVPNAVATKE